MKIINIKQRMNFCINIGDKLDWNLEKSIDDGKSWQLAWKNHYTRN